MFGNHVTRGTDPRISLEMPLSKDFFFFFFFFSSKYPCYMLGLIPYQLFIWKRHKYLFRCLVISIFIWLYLFIYFFFFFWCLSFCLLLSYIHKNVNMRIQWRGFELEILQCHGYTCNDLDPDFW